VFIQLGSDLSELAGFTSRLGQMMEVMNDLSKTKPSSSATSEAASDKKQQQNRDRDDSNEDNNNNNSNNSKSKSEAMRRTSSQQDEEEEESTHRRTRRIRVLVEDENDDTTKNTTTTTTSSPSTPILLGTIDYIEFQNLTIFTPTTSSNSSEETTTSKNSSKITSNYHYQQTSQQNSQQQNSVQLQRCLISNLNLKINKGEHLLIMGSSGSGKSSLIRVLGDLWLNNYNGTIVKPKHSDEILFLPQRTYTAFGTLLDQLTYPFCVSSKALMEDEDEIQLLNNALSMVRLDYLVKRLPHGLLSKLNWTDLLSPGEKQRLAFARLFFLFKSKRQYYNYGAIPLFIVLDEATSALDVDVEQAIYQELLQLNVTVISIGHRPTLKKFHKILLKLDGEGGYTVQNVAAAMLARRTSSSNSVGMADEDE